MNSKSIILISLNSKPTCHLEIALFQKQKELKNNEIQWENQKQKEKLKKNKTTTEAAAVLLQK